MLEKLKNLAQKLAVRGQRQKVIFLVTINTKFYLIFPDLYQRLSVEIREKRKIQDP
jgi:hypothetical protein